MKNLLFASVLISTLSLPAFARQGEHDGPDQKDDGRTIVCTDQSSGTSTVVLQFVSTAGEGQVTTLTYDLSVKSRGDDIGEMTLVDKRSGDSLKAKRLEELLKVTLTPNESQPVTISETQTHHGYAEAQVVTANSGDRATVKSMSRQGVSQFEAVLTTNENASAPISILCQKSR
jgi:hypothetical protein